MSSRFKGMPTASKYCAYQLQILINMKKILSTKKLLQLSLYSSPHPTSIACYFFQILTQNVIKGRYMGKRQLDVRSINAWSWQAENVSLSVVSDSLWPHGLKPARVLCPWDSPGKNTGVGCYALLQEIFPNPGIKPRSPAGRFFTIWATKEASSSLTHHTQIQCYKTVVVFQQSLKRCPKSPPSLTAPLKKLVNT